MLGGCFAGAAICGLRYMLVMCTYGVRSERTPPISSYAPRAVIRKSCTIRIIRSSRGNLLEARPEALVNALNDAEVMGNGIARRFKLSVSEMYGRYAVAGVPGATLIR